MDVQDAQGAYEVIHLPFVRRFSRASRAITSLAPRLDPYTLEALTMYASFLHSPRVRRRLLESHVVSTHTKYESLLYSRWAFSRGVPSVFHIQVHKFGALFRNFDRSRRYIAASESSRRDLEERFGVPVAAVVPPGVPEVLLSLPRREEDMVLFVARLQESKGTFEVVQIFERIAPMFPSTRLVVVGDGPDRVRMERDVRRRNLGSRVVFQGSLPHREVLELYTRTRLLLFPSHLEVFGIVPLEAMAAGCPVIASDLPGIAESTGGHAVLLPLGSLEPWGGAVVRLMSDPGERHRLGAAGRAWAARRTWSESARLYEEQLELATKRRESKQVTPER